MFIYRFIFINAYCTYLIINALVHFSSTDLMSKASKACNIIVKLKEFLL